MKVLAFKKGKLAKCFDSVKECADELRITEDIIRTYFMTATEMKTGWSFDMPIDGIDYKGYGFLG